MKNLLIETKEKLEENDKTPEDVEWCGNEEFGWLTWEEFKELADVEYDAGFGGEEVATDLKIVGKDFWLERSTYDGSEWWEFKTLPQKPDEHRRPDKVIEQDIGDDAYQGLWDLNKHLK